MRSNVRGAHDGALKIMRVITFLRADWIQEGSLRLEVVADVLGVGNVVKSFAVST